VTANSDRRAPVTTAVTPASGAPRSRYGTLSDPDSLREFARNLREGIYITSPEGRILDANPAFLAMVGVASLDDLQELTAVDLYVDPQRREEESTLLERDGAVREFELTLRRLDGELRTVLDTAYAITDPETGERFYHGILIDITARKQLEDQLLDMSIHDALTGCLNRRVLADLETALDAEPEKPWGCIFVDIDHFKRYNDERGHQAGDEVLVRMARFLMWHVRTEEAVVRYGGDEFVVLLNGADARATELVAERLRAAALESAPVPFSIGWASRETGESISQLVDRADRNMMSVRVEGRSRRESDR
jgi:diguanylate cyclase (GGDEF)-like protein/PAS domain S-box-containing protein